MIEPLLTLMLFAIPVTARDWRGLFWRGVVSALLTLGAVLWATGGRLSLQVEGGDANIGAGIVLYYALTTLLGGLVARTLSLGARRLGHHRPWSLWIEVLFFLGFPVLVRWAAAAS